MTLMQTNTCGRRNMKLMSLCTHRFKFNVSILMQINYETVYTKMNLFMDQILLNPGTVCMDFMRVPLVNKIFSNR